MNPYAIIAVIVFALFLLFSGLSAWIIAFQPEERARIAKAVDRWHDLVLRIMQRRDERAEQDREIERIKKEWINLK
ncbi:MAG: hypothetical protein ABIJ45_13640 [Candidatus Zixiibacteriota bacterium]